MKGEKEVVKVNGEVELSNGVGRKEGSRSRAKKSKRRRDRSPRNSRMRRRWSSIEKTQEGTGGGGETDAGDEVETEGR